MPGSYRRQTSRFPPFVEEFSSDVRVPWQVLNAGHFAVPQHRLLLGARKGERLQLSLRPTLPAGASLSTACHGSTCADALGDLPDADLFNALIGSDSVKAGGFPEPSAYAAGLRCLANDAWHFGHVREWNPALLTSSARTAHTDISRRRFRETEPGKTEPISRFFNTANGRLQYVAGRHGRGARCVHQPEADSLPVRPLRDRT